MITENIDDILFPVKKLPTLVDYTGIRGFSGVKTYAGDCIVNLHTNQVIGQVGSDYTLISNEDFLDAVKTIYPFRIKWHKAYYRPDHTLFHIMGTSQQEENGVQIGVEVVNSYEGRTAPRVYYCLWNGSYFIYTDVIMSDGLTRRNKDVLHSLQLNAINWLPKLTELKNKKVTRHILSTVKYMIPGKYWTKQMMDWVGQFENATTLALWEHLCGTSILIDVWSQKNFEHARMFSALLTKTYLMET